MLFRSPFSLTVDAEGNVYVADSHNHCIRRVSPRGVVNTLAGGVRGELDGTGRSAQFNVPSSIALGADGNLYVTALNRVRKVTLAGVVTTLAGSSHRGFTNGSSVFAAFDAPTGIASGAEGTIYVADNGNHCIRRVTAAGAVSTFAGSTAGFADGPGTTARFYGLHGLAIDGEGNIYTADMANDRIRKITQSGFVTTLAGSNQGFADGNGLNALFRTPHDIAVDDNGNLYVADTGNHRIRVIRPKSEL